RLRRRRASRSRRRRALAAGRGAMNVLLWHLHGSWTTAFVQGRHRYFVPVDAERGPFGRGRARTWDWPASVVEIDLAAARPRQFDVVLLQRPQELDLVARCLGVRP